MELHDSTRFFMALHYRARLQPGQTLVMTYESDILRIFRAIGNDSRLKVEMTALQLKKYEPNVSLWPGDVIQHLHHGEIIREECGGEDEQLKAYQASFK